MALESCLDFLVVGLLIISRYSMMRPVDGSMTKLVINSLGRVEWSCVHTCAVRSGALIGAL